MNLLASAELPQSPTRLIGRLFFAVAAGTALLSAISFAVLPLGIDAMVQAAIVGALLLLALASLLANRLSARAGFPMTGALCGSAVLMMLVVGLISAALQDSLRGPALAFCTLVVCVVGAITRPRYAVLLALAGAVDLTALVWLGHESGWPGSSVVPSLGAVLLHQWLALGCGAIAGSVISQVLDRYIEAAAERERRFRGLLGIAVDWYWEQDHHFRFTKISQSLSDDTGARSNTPMRGALWQITDMGLTAAELDAHRADLESHRPFNALLARKRDANGRWRHVSLSGEPKFDANGVFTGYWGVARDVTDEIRAQRAIAASETRYRELFTRSPSPLFLHRRGVVFDANEAAARLFGFANAAAMNGFNIGALFPPGPGRDRALERVGQLENMDVGGGVPVTDFTIRSIDGRMLSVQATAVRVETSSGPASLSIFFDITARQAVEGALRRSEAMLSHLFANSPDSIALTEMATGRYAMVNPAFCKLTGFNADEVVGRTAAELGLWHDQRTFDQLLTLLDRNGTVSDLPAVFVSKSGALVSMLLAAGRFAMDQRDYLVVNARDVTASERTRLQHSAILERASIGIALTRERHIVEVNPYFERMFGWEHGALVGQPNSVLWEDAEAYREVSLLAAPVLAAALPFDLERRMRRFDGSTFWCRLMAQVVDRNDPLHGGVIWIAEDVTERRRFDAALAAARDAAEAASQAKSSFLANTSHEIRTPLNGLLGLARLAMQEDLVDSRRQQYLEQIVDSAQSLAGIMSDILDVSKIEAGRLALEDTPFDLRGALEAVHHAYASLAESKGLKLHLSIDAALPDTVRGDPVRVRQILSNFITNALKFTERGDVAMEAEAISAARVRFSVTDTGPGIAPELQERLFMPFSQGDSSTTRRFGGTGLGLSICRELAQLMGGTVGVESVPGEGSRFWAELPLPPGSPEQAPTDTEHGDIERLYGTRVLLAEDNPVNMMIGVALLEQWGVRVVQACDGREAIEQVRAASADHDPFDAVLMDVQMPLMDGHEAARALRREYTPRQLPIIALTAAALVSERDEALDAGMDDFLTKPIDAVRLRHVLAGLIRRSDAHA